jgi:serine/threonine protein kinase
MLWLIVVVGCALGVGGCGGDDGVLAPRWQLRAGSATLAVDAPAHFDGALAPGQPFTLSLELVVPEAWRGDGVTLSIPYWGARAELTVDSAAVRPLTGEPFDGYRGRGPHAWFIGPALTERGELTLVLHAEHTWPQSGRLPAAPRITRGEALDRHTAAVIVTNDHLTGGGFYVLLTIAFTAASIFFLDRRQRSYGWMSVQFGTAAYYMAFTTGMSQAVFGTYDVALLCATVLASVIASVYETCEQFALPSPPRQGGILCVIALAGCLACVDPFIAARYCAPLVAASAVPMLVWQILVHLRMGRAGHINARLRMVAWAAILVGSPTDSLIWFGLDPSAGVRLLPLAYTIYGLVQFIALSRRLLLSLRHADALNAELAERMKSIEVLNQELRRQIAERSRQLAHALGRLATGAGPVALTPDTVVEERYRVVGKLGAGAMGTVYEVVRLTDSRRLAMKVLGKHSDASRLARFAREAQIAAAIDHPNVVSILDVDFAHAGFMFIVMELIEGPSLRGCKARYGERPWADEVLLGAAEGLAAIHAHGIVHRDLKPDNVLLAAAGGRVQAKISDFGISNTDARARPLLPPEPAPASEPAPAPASEPAIDPSLSAATDTDRLDNADEPTRTVVPSSEIAPEVAPEISSDTERSELTPTGMLLGTPSYMAPELAAAGAEPAPSSDVYSLGVIAFELYTGRRPYEQAPALARLSGALIRPLLRFRDHCPGLDGELAALLDRALSLEPEVRPAARDLADALRRRAGARRA